MRNDKREIINTSDAFQISDKTFKIYVNVILNNYELTLYVKIKYINDNYLIFFQK